MADQDTRLTSQPAPGDLVEAAVKRMKDVEIGGHEKLEDFFSQNCIRRIAEAALPTPTAPQPDRDSVLRDLLADAYSSGATDTHNSWVRGDNGSEPDFGEAASDYASSVDLAALATTEPQSDGVGEALKDYAAFGAEVGGSCLAISMSTDDPKADEICVGLFRKSQDLALQHIEAIRAATDGEDG